MPPALLAQVFINAEREPEWFGARSMQDAHQLGAAKLLKPAAPASSKIAAALFPVRLPNHSSSAEVVMPIHTVLCRPRRTPKRWTARSDNHPPMGDKIVIAMKGVVAQSPPLAIVSPRTRVR